MPEPVEQRFDVVIRWDSGNEAFIARTELYPDVAGHGITHESALSSLQSAIVLAKEQDEPSDASTEELYLSLRVVESGNPTVVALKGMIDVHTAPLLRNRIRHMIEKQDAKNIILDMSEVDYMDSTGLGVLISVIKRLQDARGSLVLAALQPRMMRVLEITNLKRLFTVASTVAEASAPHAAGRRR